MIFFYYYLLSHYVFLLGIIFIFFINLSLVCQLSWLVFIKWPLGKYMMRYHLSASSLHKCYFIFESLDCSYHTWFFFLVVRSLVTFIKKNQYHFYDFHFAGYWHLIFLCLFLVYIPSCNNNINYLWTIIYVRYKIGKFFYWRYDEFLYSFLNY